jgi:hypothetical protein
MAFKQELLTTEENAICNAAPCVSRSTVVAYSTGTPDSVSGSMVNGSMVPDTYRYCMRNANCNLQLQPTTARHRIVVIHWTKT